MDILEKYYKERFYSLGMQEYKTLSKEEKKKITGTFDFALYNLRSKIEEHKESIKKSFNLN